MALFKVDKPDTARTFSNAGRLALHVGFLGDATIIDPFPLLSFF